MLSLLLLNFALLIFCRLTITIDNEKITAKFGFGIISKSIKIDAIDVAKIEKVKTDWVTGIGIRLTNGGILFNIKPGYAIKLVRMEGRNAFLIGTDDFEAIKKLLVLNALTEK